MIDPRPEAEIQAEIKKRISPQAPTPNDLEFYLRKARRLENENTLIQDELNKVRVRLRRAEDYQIKYDALTKEAHTLRVENEEKDRHIRDLKGLNEKLARTVEDKATKHQQWSLERRELLDEIDKWTRKADESESRRVREVASERACAQQAVRKATESARKENIQKEQQLQFELKITKRALHEKETVEAVVSARVEKIRKEKDEEIVRLAQVAADEKDMRKKEKLEHAEQLGKLKEKFEKVVNFQLQGLKKNLEDQGEVFSIELNGLKEIIAIKNDEISKLLQEMKSQGEEHGKDRQRLLAEVALLKDRIYQTSRQGEEELDNLKKKLLEIHAADVRDIEHRYEELITSLKGDKTELEGFLREKDRVRERQREDHIREVEEMKDRVRQRDQRATQLQDHIKETGDLNTSELKNLHESFHKIQVEKENMAQEYTTNVTFMTQQITKLTAAGDAKNTEIKKLQDQLYETKQHYQNEIKELSTQMREERKEYENERDKDRKERDQLADRLITAEREFKANEKRLTRQRDRQMRENNKKGFIIEELERDTGRLNKYIKGLDEALKNEYKKSQMNIIEGSGSKRELTSQLNKQKLQFETMKDIEVDQVKREYERDVIRLKEENEKLKTDVLNKSVALEKAETEVKKLDFQHRNMERINRDKMIDYEKKMATLSSEINLTQQLYQNFMEAKARKGIR